jgi:GT2 family glycosyltransferase
MRLSVVICAYTEARWDALVAAVASMRDQTVSPEEIIVVIDHNDALLARARAALPGATVIANERALGLSGARNSGIAAARGEIVAFLDDDAVAAPDWLARLAAGYRDARVLGVGGAIVPRWSGAAPAWFPAEFGWVVGCSYLGQPEATAPVRNLIGANMSARRDLFEAVGGFSDALGRVGTLPLGCEETELCIRARQHWPGRHFLHEPGASVAHLVPEARARWAYFRARCFAEGLSKARVARLVGTDDGLASEWAYTLRVLPGGVLRGVADGLLRRESAGFARAAAIVAGFACTVAGYAVGVARERSAARNGHPATGATGVGAPVGGD